MKCEQPTGYTAYPMKQHRVFTLFCLASLVKQRKSVCCPKTHCWRGPVPAAFMINQPGAVLHRLFEEGMFVYKRKDER